MFDYADLRDNVVKPQIEKFGQSATLTQPGTPTGPEWDPVPGTPTAYSVKVLKIGFTVADRSRTLVREDDLKFMMSTEGDPLPDLKGTLTVGANVYQVYKMEPVGPGAIVLFWNIYCRK